MANPAIISQLWLDYSGHNWLTGAMDTKHSLITLAETLAAHHGVTHFAISMRALGKGDFFKKLIDGADCRTATATRLLLWFAANWPIDLEWPRDVQRPQRQKRVA